MIYYIVTVMATVYTSIKSRDVFLKQILLQNPGFIVIKFGAQWCGPCEKIKEYLENKKKTLGRTVHYYDLDVDDNFDVYAFLKKNKMVSGIPVLLAYKQGNVSFVTDYSVSGTNLKEIDYFFNLVNGVHSGQYSHESNY